MIVAASLIKHPRRPHCCAGHSCGLPLAGEHIRAFGVDPNEGIYPQAIRICLECARKMDDPKLRPLVLKPVHPRTPGQDRTMAQRFADAFREVQLWQDGVDDPEIADLLGLDRKDLGLGFWGVDGDTLLEMGRDLAHATAWPKDYRNHYLANGADEARWDKLVEWGFAAKGQRVSWMEGVAYSVSPAGKEALREMEAYL